MTVVTSTYLAFKAALVARLQADSSLAAPVQVTYGQPRNEAPKDWIGVGGIKGGQTAAALGQQRREEDYTITILVSCVRNGFETQLVTERALTLAAVVEASIRNWGLAATPFGGIVRVAQVEGRYDVEETWNDTVRCTDVYLEVRVQNRI